MKLRDLCFETLDRNRIVYINLKLIVSPTIPVGFSPHIPTCDASSPQISKYILLSTCTAGLSASLRLSHGQLPS